MNWIWRLLVMLIGHQAKLRALAEAKKRGTLAYLRFLQGSRRLLLSLIIFALLLNLMMLCLVAAVISGVWLLDLETTTKLQILFALFATGFVVPAALMAYVFSQGFWYKHSGADKLVEDLLKQDQDSEAA